MPVKERPVRSIELIGDSLLVLTRSHLVIGKDFPDNPDFSVELLPHPEGYTARTSLFRALWLLHSGEIFGLAGKIIVDLLALIMIFLTLTGIIWFVAPDLMKSFKNRLDARKRFVRINRFSIKWHNLLGIWVVVFLLINTIAGAFLRPPLLISILKNDVANIKGTILDNVNPWHDKLRDIRFDKQTGNILISTSEGFFSAEPSFADSLKRISVQPPVSVMGINVFEQLGHDSFLVGSFSGIYLWNPFSGELHDKITGLGVSPARGMANPFGLIPVAGYIKTEAGNEYIFDYDAGVFSLSHAPQFPKMPVNIKKETPLPLWNLALEVHVGRFYSFIFGRYYILFIPMAALIVVSILISGMALWIRNHRRKIRIRKNCNPNNHDQKKHT